MQSAAAFSMSNQQAEVEEKSERVLHFLLLNIYAQRWRVQVFGTFPNFRGGGSVAFRSFSSPQLAWESQRDSPPPMSWWNGFGWSLTSGVHLALA